MRGKGGVALVMAACLALSSACTIAIPILAGHAASSHNRSVRRAEAAGEEPKRTKRSVNRYMVRGLLVGAVIDALIFYAAVNSVRLEFDHRE